MFVRSIYTALFLVQQKLQASPKNKHRISQIWEKFKLILNIKKSQSPMEIEMQEFTPAKKLDITRIEEPQKGVSCIENLEAKFQEGIEAMESSIAEQKQRADEASQTYRSLEAEGVRPGVLARAQIKSMLETLVFVYMEHLLRVCRGIVEWDPKLRPILEGAEERLAGITELFESVLKIKREINLRK